MPRTLLVFALGALSGLALASKPPAPAPLPVDHAPVVRSADQAHTRVAPSGKASVKVLALGQQAFVGELRLNGGGKVPVHRDPTEETIVVLSGSGTITLDGVQHAISAGSTVFMPANAEVSYDNGPEELVALQVFAGPAPSEKYLGWTTAP